MLSGEDGSDDGWTADFTLKSRGKGEEKAAAVGLEVRQEADTTQHTLTRNLFFQTIASELDVER